MARTFHGKRQRTLAKISNQKTKATYHLGCVSMGKKDARPVESAFIGEITTGVPQNVE